jgi:type III secretion protein L
MTAGSDGSRQDSSTRDSSFRPVGAVLRAREMLSWFDGQAYLEEARRRSGLTMARAEEGYRLERQRGYAEGHREGLDEALEVVLATRIQAAAFLDRLNEELPDLVLQILRGIIAQFEPADLIAHATVKALEQWRQETNLVLATAPDDVAAVRSRLEALLGKEGGRLRLTVQSDPRLPRGSGVLRSEFARVDIAIDAQLEQLANALRAAPVPHG